MNMGKVKSLFVISLLASSQSALAFNLEFNFDYDSNNFFSDATYGTDRTNLLNSAGSYFEGIIQDSFTAIESDDNNHFNASFFNPSAGSSNEDRVTITDFSVAADTITIFVGAHNMTGATLAWAGNGGYSTGGTGNDYATWEDNAVTRGQGDGTQSSVIGGNATDFALWGGQIAFNSDSSWYYDPDVSDSILPGIADKSDFYSVALHEIGHVLGIGLADSWDNQIANGKFTGTNVNAAYGSNPDVQASGGHFAAGTEGTVGSVSQEVAMDPNITLDTQKKFTDVDVAALADIGWEVLPASGS